MNLIFNITALICGLATNSVGRASTALVDSIRVDYYGTPTPLNQVASVSIPDSRTISISPWDRSAFTGIEKAIMKSDLGLTPINDGRAIRINIPPLTEDRRKDLVKMAKKYTEDTKVAIRNVRRDVNEAFKKLLSAKEISEDESHKAQDEIQEISALLSLINSRILYITNATIRMSNISVKATPLTMLRPK